MKVGGIVTVKEKGHDIAYPFAILVCVSSHFSLHPLCIFKSDVDSVRRVPLLCECFAIKYRLSFGWVSCFWFRLVFVCLLHPQHEVLSQKNLATILFKLPCPFTYKSGIFSSSLSLLHRNTSPCLAHSSASLSLIRLRPLG
jgi:hypothetical protein